MPIKQKIIVIVMSVFLIVSITLYLSQAQINVTEYEVIVDPVKVIDNKTLHEVNGLITIYVPIAVKKDKTIHEVMN